MLSREQHSHPPGNRGCASLGSAGLLLSSWGQHRQDTPAEDAALLCPVGSEAVTHLNKAQEQQEEFQDSQQGDQIGKLSCQAKDNPGEVKVL